MKYQLFIQSKPNGKLMSSFAGETSLTCMTSEMKMWETSKWTLSLQEGLETFKWALLIFQETFSMGFRRPQLHCKCSRIKCIFRGNLGPFGSPALRFPSGQHLVRVPPLQLLQLGLPPIVKPIFPPFYLQAG